MCHTHQPGDGIDCMEIRRGRPELEANHARQDFTEEAETFLMMDTVPDFTLEG